MIGFDLGIFILLAVEAYSGILILYIVLTLIQSLGNASLPDVLRPAANFVYDVCEPFLRIFRGLLPSIPLGGMGLDISPILAFLVLRILAGIVRSVFF